MKSLIKKVVIVITALVFCAAGFAQDWSISSHAPDSSSTGNWQKADFKINNNSGSSVPMSELTVKYWYTREGSASEAFSCWWAQVGTSNVSGSFSDVTPAVTGANRYCKISFSVNAGTILNGSDSGGIYCAWHKSDWSNYNYTDDYSYNSELNYILWDKITLYHNGVLVYGTEPVAGDTPTATPTPIEETPTPTPTPTPIEETPTPTPTPTPIEETPTPTPTPTPIEETPTPTPTGGSAGEGILIQAEDYVGYSDTTSGNAGGAYRTDDVDIESCSEGGFDVGWITQGEYLEFEFTNTTSDIFDIYARVASPIGNTQGFRIEIDSVDVSGLVSVPITPSWQSWQDAIAGDISINAGTHTLKLSMNGDFNLNFIYIVSSTNPPEPTPVPGAMPTSTPPANYVGIVEQYGQLQVIGTSLCDESGNPVRIKGVCTHGLQWVPFMPEHTVHNLAYDWGVEIVRPAMYVEDYKNGEFWGGYIANPDYMKQKLTEIIADALDAGIYVIIDWHIHNDPLNFVNEATAFFTEMATLYGNYPNIVYEICNEPEYVSWSTVKTYANNVIPVIRNIDSDNIIIVGTPSWCQEVNVAADDPLTGYTNIVYSMHFYAGTHGQNIRDNGNYALGKGLPIFVSEWGTSQSDGGSNGQVYLTESQVWLDWMDSNNLSWINWNFSNKGESSAALLPGVSMGGPWQDSDLTASGAFIKGKISATDPDPTPTPTADPDPTPTPTADPDPTPTPDGGDCDNIFSGGQTGNFGTEGAYCFKTQDTIHGWGCSNFFDRTIYVTVNGSGTAVTTCGNTLPAKGANDYYVFECSAGGPAWSAVYWW